jgi:hypothetical protein
LHVRNSKNLERVTLHAAAAKYSESVRERISRIQKFGKRTILLDDMLMEARILSAASVGALKRQQIFSLPSHKVRLVSHSTADSTETRVLKLHYY